VVLKPISRNTIDCSNTFEQLPKTPPNINKQSIIEKLTVRRLNRISKKEIPPYTKEYTLVLDVDETLVHYDK
jgi:hypothetical protein